MIVVAVLAGACADAPRPAPPPAAVGTEAVARERAEYAAWLATAPSSPFRAIVQHPLGQALTIGPDGADIPLGGVGPVRIAEAGGRLTFTSADGTRPLGRDRLTAIGGYHLLAGGPAGRTVITVFGDSSSGHGPPVYFPDAPGWRFEVTLTPADGPDGARLLAPDGTEVEATEAGTVRIPVGADTVALRVFRLRVPGREESELEIYFQDATNGRGTYPAGRWVNLLPAGPGRYVVDFNRARNPFCAYNTVFPCPAPWRGNRLPADVPAGERYEGTEATAPKGAP